MSDLKHLIIGIRWFAIHLHGRAEVSQITKSVNNLMICWQDTEKFCSLEIPNKASRSDLTTDYDVCRLVLVSHGQNVITGLRLTLTHQEGPILAFLQKLLGGSAGQVSVKPSLSCRIGAVQWMPKFYHLSILFAKLEFFISKDLTEYQYFMLV